MNLKLLYFLGFIFFNMLLSCQRHGEKTMAYTPFEFDTIPVTEKIKRGLNDNYLEALGMDKSTKLFLKDFYKKNAFQPLWTEDLKILPVGLKMAGLMNNKLSFGIPELRKYPVPFNNDNFIKHELKLTACLSVIMADLKSGFLIPDSAAFKPTQHEKFDEIIDFTDKMNAENLSNQLMNCGPIEDTTYLLLAQELLDRFARLPIDKGSYEIKSFRDDSLETVFRTHAALLHKGYLNSEEIDSLALEDALKEFQKDNGLNPDGVIGKYTAFALNESSFRKLNRIALAMEKRRWKKEYGPTHLYINLPQYKLKFIALDTLRSTHNVVIGKWGNETPAVKASVRNIVIYPYWRVPYSISSKEILPAVQRNSNYLKKHNYKIYRNEKEVNPSTVNWKSIKQNAFPYVVVQGPGPKNSLGIIKFDMPNKESIYVHDTPSKSLFKADIRPYSHGCMRCENPLDLAKEMVTYDLDRKGLTEYRAESIDSLVELKEHFKLKLKNSIPVIIDYVTVVVEDEKVIVYPDIYKRDEEYMRIFYQ